MRLTRFVPAVVSVGLVQAGPIQEPQPSPSSLKAPPVEWTVPPVLEPVLLRGHEDVVRAVAFSADGKRVATASADRTARVWATNGTEKPVVLRGHEDQMTTVAFSPDGSRVVTGSADKT